MANSSNCIRPQSNRKEDIGGMKVDDQKKKKPYFETIAYYSKYSGPLLRIQALSRGLQWTLEATDSVKFYCYCLDM